jgi:hypothetical protein
MRADSTNGSATEYEMTKLLVAALLVALTITSPASAKLSPEDQALKAEWKAAKGLLVVTLDPRVKLVQAHDAIMRRFIAGGSEIVSDHPLQIVATQNLNDVNPTAAMFAQALAGDPRGGPMTARRVASFIESPGEPLRVRFCFAIGQTNRFGGSTASDCGFSFKQWKEARTTLLDALSPEAVGASSQTNASEKSTTAEEAGS